MAPSEIPMPFRARDNFNLESLSRLESVSSEYRTYHQVFYLVTDLKAGLVSHSSTFWARFYS